VRPVIAGHEKLRRGEKESGQNSFPLTPSLLPALFFSGGAGALPPIGWLKFFFSCVSVWKKYFLPCGLNSAWRA